MFPHRLKRRGAALAVLVVVLAVAGVWWWETHRPFLDRRASAASALVSADRISKTVEVLAARPYRAGAAAGADPAAEVERRLASAGLKTWNDVRDADVWEPVSLRVAVAGKELDLRGPAMEPAFLAYSADGDVEAPLVYARNGTDADFDHLRKARVDPRGKVALLRGGACPAAAVAAAERAGAAAVLVYADPADGTGAPGGTLLRTFRRSGDPRRSKEQGVETLPRIPAVPVPRDAAEALLREAGGPEAPAAWKGALSAPYALGPSKVRVRVAVRGKTARARLRSVLASLPGADPKAPPVFVMSHLDTLGPSAGTAASTAVVLEAADVLARLASDGWRPARSVVFAFWDGGAYGGLGSTGWVEAHTGAAGLPAAAVLDVTAASGAGPLAIARTPGLGVILGEALRRVPELAPGGSLAPAAAPAALPALVDDAAPFLGLTASPVVTIGFAEAAPPAGAGSTAAAPVPGDARVAILARAVALLSGALADPRLFPFRFGELATYVHRELNEIQARQPAALGWLPGAVRALDRPLDGFDAAAAAWDDYLASRTGRSRDRARADELGGLALAALGSPGSFGRGCALWGPAEATGCAASGFPALEDAVRRRDRAGVEKEIGQIAAAVTRAREYLVAADWLGRGKAKAREPRPRIPVKE